MLMYLWTGWICLVFGATAVAGCASTDVLSRELSRMRREVREVQKELMETRRQVERLESRVTLLSLGSGGVERAPATPVHAPPRVSVRGQQVESGARVVPPRTGRVLPVVRLGQQATPPPGSPDAAYDEGALDDGSPPVMIKLGPSVIDNERLSVDHGVLTRPDPVLEGSSGDRGYARVRYKRALATFREDGKPEVAYAQFESFLREYPHSRFAGNALYWAGECLYSLGRFEDAVRTFGRLVADFPESAKVPHALLRTAEVHMAKGQDGEARKILEALIQAHPTSAAAPRARAHLKAKGK